jgi:hypothetical protein
MLRRCAAVVLSLLTQAITAQEVKLNHTKQHVACPAVPTKAYISCDEMHHIDNGLNIFREKLLHFLDAAYCQRRAAVLPKIRAVVGASDWMKWTDVFETRSFAHYLLTRHGIHAVLPECVPPDLEAATGTQDCVAATNNTLAKMPVPVSTHHS